MSWICVLISGWVAAWVTFFLCPAPWNIPLAFLSALAAGFLVRTA